MPEMLNSWNINVYKTKATLFKV